MKHFCIIYSVTFKCSAFVADGNSQSNDKNCWHFNVYCFKWTILVLWLNRLLECKLCHFLIKECSVQTRIVLTNWKRKKKMERIFFTLSIQAQQQTCDTGPKIMKNKHTQEKNKILTMLLKLLNRLQQQLIQKPVECCKLFAGC